MDGMLSQDEINALLNGVDLSADSGAAANGKCYAVWCFIYKGYST